MSANCRQVTDGDAVHVEHDLNMTRFTGALVALALMAQPGLAQQTKPAEKASQAPQPTSNPAEFDKRLAQVRDHMTRMQEQMDRIRQTQEPQERQRLLQEHWTSMQSAMSTMNGMWGAGGCCAAGGGMGPGMMRGGGPMMGWSHMRGYYSQLTPEQLRQRQYMMDQYMPMQQMMMEHMMWHQRWMTQPPATTK